MLECVCVYLCVFVCVFACVIFVCVCVCVCVCVRRLSACMYLSVSVYYANGLKFSVCVCKDVLDICECGNGVRLSV